MKPIRVLIVEDSPVFAEHLRRIIGADPVFEIAGIVSSAEEALEVLDRVAPDVISMDVHLPGMQGLEATRQIMKQRPTPIVIVSGIDAQDVNLTMQALRAGALAVVEKPVAASHAAHDAMASRLRTQLAIMSEVRLVRQREFGGMRETGRTAVPECHPSEDGYQVLAMAASTGGPNALVRVLAGLGPKFPLPIAIVQHMIPSFVEGFAAWLSSVAGIPVTLVTGPTPMEPGKAYISGVDAHLIVRRDVVTRGNGLRPSVTLDRQPPVGGHRPAASVLFSSVARHYGTGGIGVLLTGMGEDGATGLSELRAAGGYTLAEAESSAVVYGMPAAAVRLGAVCESLHLNDISGRILALAKPGGEHS